MKFANQFCQHRPKIGLIQNQSRFSLVSITESKSDRLKEYVQERQSMIDRFNNLITKQLKTDENLSLDSFKILRRLGKGGFGSVFLAYHTNTNEYLALKAMKKSTLVENHDQNMIISERQYAFALHHPNIVNINSNKNKKSIINN
jgi:serine/threonine protein kinase